MAGTLYVVAMPIGNLADITYRAVDVLKSVDFILAEDTRTTQRVLSHYGIDTPFLSSVYQGAERQRIVPILERLKEGKQLALVSDAGTPLISDPGFPLVRAVVDAGVPVVPVPGPCAAIVGLVASGLPTDRFGFEGSLPRSLGARRSLFESLAFRESTTVFYESSHRIADSLQLLAEILPKRQLVLARELTKVHEEFLRGTAAQLLEVFRDRDRVRGEFVMVLGGATSPIHADRRTAERLLVELRSAGLPNRSIVRILVQGLEMSRNEAYRLVHETDDVV
jgi:16S rRNA (cytidine1402-2'-O)-methyltransferase